jgi:MFS family permease
VGELFVARERGKYQGVLAAAFIVAAVLGPGLGGWLADAGLWRAIFYINVPLGILAAICLHTFFPQTHRQLSSSKDPIIPAHVFKSRLINICLATVFVSGIGMFGGSLVLAVLLQQVFHVSATQSGYALTPLMLVVAVASIVSGYLVSRTGRYKILCLIGLLFMSAGCILLAFVNSRTPLYVVYADAAINGIGLGLLLPVHAIVVQNAVKDAVLGFATSMTQLFRSLGGTIGTAILSAILLYLLKSQTIETALTTIFWIHGITVAATLVLNFFLPEVELKRSSIT